MAKQDIYLGVEGNDGTGDSIREAFRKANENFTELYAVFGQGGTISFTALNDTPSAITPNGVLIGNTTGTEMIQKTLTGGTGINIDNTSATNITITNTGANINADTSPILGGPLNGNAVYAIGKIATSAAAIQEFNQTHASQITIDDIVTDKKYQDAADLVGSYMGTYGLSSMAFALLLTLYTSKKRINRKMTHMISLLLGGSGFIIMRFIENPNWLILSFMLIGISWGSILSMPYAMLSSSIDENKMGLYMGLFNMLSLIHI